MNNKPLISIILSYHNENPDFFYNSINSILNQSYKNFEFIIIQDSGKYLKLPDDKRIKFLKNERRLGLGLSMNKAINIAKGEFIARQDSDDISVYNRLEVQLKFMIDNPMFDLIGSSALIINSENKTLGIWNQSTIHKDLCSEPWKEIPIKHPSWFFRRLWFLRETGHYNKNFRGQDQHFLITNFKKSKYHQIPTPLLFYRIKKISKYYKLIGRISVIQANIENKSFGYAFLAILYSIINFILSFFNFSNKILTANMDDYFGLSKEKKNNYYQMIK